MNNRGITANERLIEEITYAESAEDAEHREILATKALGAADIAVEFGLITYNEWEDHVSRIFQLI